MNTRKGCPRCGVLDYPDLPNEYWRERLGYQYMCSYCRTIWETGLTRTGYPCWRPDVEEGKWGYRSEITKQPVEVALIIDELEKLEKIALLAFTLFDRTYCMFTYMDMTLRQRDLSNQSRIEEDLLDKLAEVGLVVKRKKK